MSAGFRPDDGYSTVRDVPLAPFLVDRSLLPKKPPTPRVRFDGAE